MPPSPRSLAAESAASPQAQPDETLLAAIGTNKAGSGQEGFSRGLRSESGPADRTTGSTGLSGPAATTGPTPLSTDTVEADTASTNTVGNTDTSSASAVGTTNSVSAASRAAGSTGTSAAAESGSLCDHLALANLNDAQYAMPWSGSESSVLTRVFCKSAQEYLRRQKDQVLQGKARPFPQEVAPELATRIKEECADQRLNNYGDFVREYMALPPELPVFGEKDTSANHISRPCSFSQLAISSQVELCKLLCLLRCKNCADQAWKVFLYSSNNCPPTRVVDFFEQNSTETVKALVARGLQLPSGVLRDLAIQLKVTKEEVTVFDLVRLQCGRKKFTMDSLLKFQREEESRGVKRRAEEPPPDTSGAEEPPPDTSTATSAPGVSLELAMVKQELEAVRREHATRESLFERTEQQTEQRIADLQERIRQISEQLEKANKLILFVCERKEKRRKLDEQNVALNNKADQDVDEYCRTYIPASLNLGHLSQQGSWTPKPY